MTPKQITSKIKAYLNEQGYINKIFVRSIRGTFHCDNCGNYMLSAKQIAEQATGLEFVSYGTSMTRLKV